MEEGKVDLAFFRRSWQLFKISGTQIFSRISLYLIQTILIALLNAQLLSVFAEWSGDSYKTFADITYKKVLDSLPVGFLYGAGLGICVSYSSYLEKLLQWHWQSNITNEINKRYLVSSIPFHVIQRKGFDNPDQRIVNDISDLCDSVSNICVSGITEVTSIIILTVSMVRNEKSGGWKISIAGFIIAVVFFIGMRYIVSNLSQRLFAQDKYEGNFRYIHSRIRTYSESISFYHSEAVEWINSEKSLAEVISNMKKLTLWNFLSKMWITFMLFLPQGIISIIVVISIWNLVLSPLDAQALMSTQIMMVVSIMTANFRLFKLSGSFAMLFGSVGRVGQLLELCNELKECNPLQQNVVTYKDDMIWFKNVQCKALNKTTLVQNFNLKVEKFKNVIIMGPTGIGKSSLLRCLSGHWNYTGQITRPSQIGKGILFLSQKTYFTQGTLRDQITFPSTIDYTNNAFNYNDDYIINCCKLALLDLLVIQRGLDSKENWYETLSPGEQQRVGFARLFYHQPTFATLDESTSAIDKISEMTIYQNIQLANITILSISHRHSLLQFHNILVNIKDDGSYTVQNINKNDALKFENYSQKWLTIINNPGSSSKQSQRIIEFENFDPIYSQDQDNNNASVVISSTGFFLALFKIWRILHSHFLSSETVFLLVLIIVQILGSITPLFMSQILQSITDSFIMRNVPDFVIASFTLLLFYTIMAFTSSVPSGSASFLGVRYRENMVRYLHRLYFGSGVIFKINSENANIIDNPDQRITKDCKDAVCGYPGKGEGIPDLLQTVLSSIFFPISATYYLLSSQGGGILLFCLLLACIIPTFIIGLIYVYFIAKYSFLLSLTQGDFRFSEIKVREYADCISFYGRHGIQKEKNNIDEQFDRFMGMKWITIMLSAAFSLFLNILMNSILPLSILFVVLNFKWTQFQIPQNEIYAVIEGLKMQVGIILASLFGIFLLFPNIGLNRALISRVKQLIDLMDTCIQKRDSKELMEIRGFKNSKKNRKLNNDIILELENIVCLTPDGNILNQIPVSLKINTNDKLLITGVSGSGKSSLLRVISGLWIPQSGFVSNFSNNTLFLPQMPYLVIGTLRDQILYPLKVFKNKKEKSSKNNKNKNNINNADYDYESESDNYDNEKTDEIIKSILKNQCSLGYLLERFQLDSFEQWEFVLSPGEQQLLSFARVFFHVPDLIFLDESTSALNPENEELIYQQCLSMDITIISIAHKDTVKKYHTKILNLDGFGGWDFQVLDES